MNHKRVLSLLVFAWVMATVMSLAFAQDNTDRIETDTNANTPPPQCTFIPCEQCVILYPDRYEKKPETCPVCHGAKEHFQPAQMMTREMAQMRLHEIDLEIQDFLYKTAINSLDKPVDIEQLKELRNRYIHKLIHLLVYDFLEIEPLKEKIITLDQIVQK